MTGHTEIIPAGVDLGYVRPASPIDHELTARTRDLAKRGTAPKTLAAYEANAARFRQWCAETGRSYFPVTSETLANYVGHLVDEGVAPSTIGQAIATVRRSHVDAGLEPPPILREVRDGLKNHRRQRAQDGVRTKQAKPIVADTMRALIAATNQDPESLTGMRDRLVITLGTNLMGRRSELANLTLADIHEAPDGLVVYVAFSKTDQRGDGEHIPIVKAQDPALCPVAAFHVWRDALAGHGITTGRLLRRVDRWGKPGSGLTPESVNRIVKGLALRAGLSEAEKYTAHALRAGGATAAALNGAPRSFIARQGRWSEKSKQVDGYVRPIDMWKDHPLRGAF